jgi:hypothetical protein
MLNALGRAPRSDKKVRYVGHPAPPRASWGQPMPATWALSARKSHLLLFPFSFLGLRVAWPAWLAALANMIYN